MPPHDLHFFVPLQAVHFASEPPALIQPVPLQWPHKPLPLHAFFLPAAVVAVQLPEPPQYLHLPVEAFAFDFVELTALLTLLMLDDVDDEGDFIALLSCSKELPSPSKMSVPLSLLALL